MTREHKLIHAIDLGFDEKFNGENIVSVQEVNGKIYLFTPSRTYIAKRVRWYHKVWNWLRRS